MTDYSKMSDFEINKAVAEYEGVRGFHCKNIGGGSALRFQSWKELDYCNNPADAWPIIVASLIEVSPDYDFTDESEQELCATGFWTANHVEDDGSSYYQSHQNPLRAAMIVFLMMKEKKE